MNIPKEVREAGIAAIANRWHGLEDCPGDMYEREAAALFDAALSALGEAGYQITKITSDTLSAEQLRAEIRSAVDAAGGLQAWGRINGANGSIYTGVSNFLNGHRPAEPNLLDFFGFARDIKYRRLAAPLFGEDRAAMLTASQEKPDV